MRPVKFLYIYITYFFYIITKLTIFFSFSKGTYQRKRCTFKNNKKSHIFSFTVRPVRFLHLYIKFCFTYQHKLQCFPFSKGTFQRNRCAFKNNIKPHILFFLQCALSDFFIFASKFVFCLLIQFTMFSCFKGTYQKKVHFQK